MAYGTLQILDTIGARRAAASDYLHIYDEQELYKQIQLFLDAHNELLTEIMGDVVAGPVTDRLMTWGGNDTVDMIDGDEYSRPDVQKIQVSPVTMGLPLRLKQIGWGVTRLFMQNKTVQDLDQVLVAIRDADVRDVARSIRRALFNPVNNTAYTDRRVDGANYPLRALLNADSATIPPDPYGNVFNAATHTHFLGTSSFAAADLQAVITTVLEHYLAGNIAIYISKSLETTVRGFTGFFPYYDSRLTLANNQTVAASVQLDITNPLNRAIGIFDAAEIYVRPWVPAGYAFFFNRTAPKPLAMRVRDNVQGTLHIAADLEIYPLRAQFMEREYGISVVERSNGACLYTGNATYAAPADWTF
jgi:hypothetical protein